MAATMKNNEPILSDGERLVMRALDIAEGLAVQGPENKGWQRAAADLKRKGLADEIMGYWFLTNDGRRMRQ